MSEIARGIGLTALREHDRDEIARAFVVDFNASVTRMAAHVGCSHSHLGRFLDEIGARETADDETAEYWRQQYLHERKQNDKLRDAHAVLSDLIRREVKTLPPVTPHYTLPAPTTVDEELVQIWHSDSHVGEWVLPSHTAGLEHYDRDVFKQRMERLKERVNSVVNGHIRHTYPVKHCYAFHLGDAASHENKYPGQAFRIDMQLAEQIVWGAYEFADLTRFYASTFETVTWYLQPGNHGETWGTTLNTDWLLYYMMQQMVSDLPNVRVVISDSPYLGYYIDETLGILDYSKGGRRRNGIICHGQQAKRYSGTPYYGLDRLLSRLDRMFRVTWDTLRCGHHHTGGEGEGWELVPSWVGGSDFSVGKLALASRPAQLINGFHPRQGETWRYKIYLEDEFDIEEIDDGTGIYTPHNRFDALNRGDVA